MYRRIGAFLGILGIVGGITSYTDVSALTYQANVGVNFTFNTTLSISTSSADIIINPLYPGTADDSNIVTVKVITNNKRGYTLTSSVGNTTYNNRNLTLRGGSEIFSSVDYGAAIDSNTDFSDNTWGYSYSVDDGSSWVAGNAGSNVSGYSGLPLYTDTTNITTLRKSSGPTSDEGDDTQFKIAARASSTQVAGEYNNVINFNVVAEPEPNTLAMAYAAAGKNMYDGYYLMQDMNEGICENTEVVDDESQIQLRDTRDNKIYWVTKLKDGHCWMIQNLDLDIDSTVTYTHADTDLGWGSDATISWTPDKSTIAWSGSSFSGWGDQNSQQYSADPGDYYYAGYNGADLLPSSTINYLTKTPDASGDITSGSRVYFSTDPSRVNGGTHGHVGNYYNWSAAVASNDTSGYTISTYGDISGNPQNSICPAGWRLPTITAVSPTYEKSGSRNEFARLVYLYNNNNYETGSPANIEKSPIFFVRSGYVYGGVLHYPGYSADYWSSTVWSNTNAYELYFQARYVGPGGNAVRYHGSSVRCLAR